MSLNSEEVQQAIDQLDRALADLARSINTMKDALRDGLPPSDKEAFLRAVQLITNMAAAIALPMDKVAIQRMEDQF